MEDFNQYDSLSIEEISRKMCDIKKVSPLQRIETENRGYIELTENHVIPIGLDNSPEFYFVGRDGNNYSMSFDEAEDILKRDKELRVERALEAKGICRADVRGFMDYLCLSMSLEKKVEEERA